MELHYFCYLGKSFSVSSCDQPCFPNSHSKLHSSVQNQSRLSFNLSSKEEHRWLQRFIISYIIHHTYINRCCSESDGVCMHLKIRIICSHCYLLKGHFKCLQNTLHLFMNLCISHIAAGLCCMRSTFHVHEHYFCCFVVAWECRSRCACTGTCLRSYGRLEGNSKS